MFNKTCFQDTSFCETNLFVCWCAYKIASSKFIRDTILLSQLKSKFCVTPSKNTLDSAEQKRGRKIKGGGRLSFAAAANFKFTGGLISCERLFAHREIRKHFKAANVKKGLLSHRRSFVAREEKSERERAESIFFCCFLFIHQSVMRVYFGSTLISGNVPRRRWNAAAAASDQRALSSRANQFIPRLSPPYENSRESGVCCLVGAASLSHHAIWPKVYSWHIQKKTTKKIKIRKIESRK